jgi:predicted amidohydrolase YtcJ
MTRKAFFLIFVIFSINVYGQMKKKADLIITHARIYCADEKFTTAGALAVSDGKFLAVGDEKTVLAACQSDKVVDAGGNFIFPGFIDAHSHFTGYSLSLQEADLTGLRSFDEVLAVLSKQGTGIAGGWLVGRGWDQNLWQNKEFPDRQKLDSLFPGRPVVLIRIDGHVVLASGTALEKAGIRDISGFKPGEVGVRNGRLTGILSEDAADRMKTAIPKPGAEARSHWIRQAEKNCFAAGLTGVADAGLDYPEVHFLDSLQQKGSLRIHLYVMLNPTQENIGKFIRKGINITHGMDVRSIKMYADGSLGSRTALLKKPYSDDPGHSGIRVTSPDSIRQVCELALKYGYQVNIHAIGDSAVKTILNLYGEFLKGKNDLRWRIEHAQVVDPADIGLFGKYSVLPSIQSTHATSDMPWAPARLGPERIRHAYAYKDLLRQNGWLPNGTDFPVERIDPLMTFYAAVARMNAEGKPSGGFQPENALTRGEALRSITIWAARGCFGEKDRGSIEPGKNADFVILDKDIMEIPIDQVPKVKVLTTYLNGAEVYSRKVE